MPEFTQRRGHESARGLLLNPTEVVEMRLVSVEGTNAVAGCPALFDESLLKLGEAGITRVREEQEPTPARRAEVSCARDTGEARTIGGESLLHGQVGPDIVPERTITPGSEGLARTRGRIGGTRHGPGWNHDAVADRESGKILPAAELVTAMRRPVGRVVLRSDRDQFFVARILLIRDGVLLFDCFDGCRGPVVPAFREEAFYLGKDVVAAFQGVMSHGLQVRNDKIPGRLAIFDESLLEQRIGRGDGWRDENEVSPVFGTKKWHPLNLRPPLHEHRAPLLGRKVRSHEIPQRPVSP